LEDQRVGAKKRSESILRRLAWRVRIGFDWLRTGTGGGLCVCVCVCVCARARARAHIQILDNETNLWNNTFRKKDLLFPRASTAPEKTSLKKQTDVIH
jgi:hypothetical protein